MRMVTAYTATMAVGLGAIAYFEKGAPASTSKVIALAGSTEALSDAARYDSALSRPSSPGSGSRPG